MNCYAAYRPRFFAFAAVRALLLPFAGCVAAFFAVDTLPGGLPRPRTSIPTIELSGISQ
jgi:hypothetical protein